MGGKVTVRTNIKKLKKERRKYLPKIADDFLFKNVSLRYCDTCCITIMLQGKR